MREIRACAAANFSHLFAVMAGHTTIVKCWSFKAESAANAVSSRALTASMQSQCNFATVEYETWKAVPTVLSPATVVFS